MTKHLLQDQIQIQQLLALAEKNGLRLSPNGLEVDESGMDFQVVFAQDETGRSWVLRKPRRADVLERADNERNVLELLKQRLPVAVPEWRIYTPELIAYPKLDGVPAGSVDMEQHGYVFRIDRQPLADTFVDSLARALAALHGVDHEAAAAAGIRVLGPQEARERFAGRMDEVKRSIGVAEELWQRWQAWISDDSCWPQHSALVHGDLHPPHILVDKSQSVTGLLDWTEAEVAIPSTDFTLYSAIFGEDELDRLLVKYEQFGGRTWPRMREHIAEQLAAYPVLIGLFALKSGNESTMQMARTALGLEGSAE
ncbi:hypothetical protein DVH26_18245 [Paenibacillus sp. H1-7]|uniref:macrolide 2'-phosphotransferase n=1 Tax=Paenibacillus sp. H1-7 TaxID=2282849 RepID=UPI001EF7F932|nr:macrolide 2'-phosphotransferase [Paenibacillus sp. H1-7]ULL16214.1 hypothetical protein DVH26_18245 [Paenibacillus sp. H1-7]